MDLRKIRPNTFAIIIAGVIALIIGTYTNNVGFQMAGGLFMLVGLLVGYSQVRGRDDSGS